jgi:hypothetical protein
MVEIGTRVALTRNYLKMASSERRHALASLRGEVIAVLAYGHLAVVQWDGVPDEAANFTCARGNLCTTRSVAFVE